jgi:transcriptional regulatory protein LevR
MPVATPSPSPTISAPIICAICVTGMGLSKRMKKISVKVSAEDCFGFL